MPEAQPAKPTPWWGRILAGAAILFALPSLMFIVAEAALDRRGLLARPGGTYLDSSYFFTGLFAPFLTPVSLLLCMYVLVARRIGVGLRLVTGAIVAASVPATLHILTAFTARFH